MSSSSSVPRCAFSATGDVSWVRTTMPSVTVVVQEATGLRCPSTSTMHCRQAPTGSSSGWSQNRGIWIPISSAARMTSVPFGTCTSKPSMVTVTRSVWTATSAVMRGPRRVVSEASDLLGCSCRDTSEDGRGDRVERAPAGQVLQELVAEQLDAADDGAGGAVAEGAERAAEDVVAGVEQRVDVGLRGRPRLHPLQDLHHPVGALATRRALAARLVRVELGP